MQAWCDLTLPEYTSRVVNVGVQQSGIESAAITKIGEKTLYTLTLFLDETDRTYVMNQYEKDGTYKKETVYRLKKDTNEEKLADKLAPAMLVVSYASDEKGAAMLNIPEGSDALAMLD